MRKLLRWLCSGFVCLLLMTGIWAEMPAADVSAGSGPSTETPTDTATPRPVGPYDLIQLINQIRTGNGLPALQVNPILMGTAQSTVDIMAGAEMMGHIGNVSGRVMDAGYGGGEIAWATENFAVLPEADPANILDLWADAEHMIPMVNPNYRDIGAGVARTPSGMIYYLIHAAYTSKGTSRMQLTSLAKTPDAVLPSPVAAAADLMSQYVFAVKVATPGSNGKLIHVVRQGQSLWSIAIAYQTHIRDICLLNGIPVDQPVVYIGQKLWIPTSAAATQAISANRTATPRATGPNLAGTDAVLQTQVIERIRLDQTQTALPTSPAVETVQSGPGAAFQFLGGAHPGIACVIAGSIVLGLILIGFGLMAQRNR